MQLFRKPTTLNRRALVAVMMSVVTVSATRSPSALCADDSDVKPAAPSFDLIEDWGPESNGLRCRLIVVPSNVDDEAPDAPPTVREFAPGEVPTFAVELKNVSAKPLTLLGTRYGDSYGPSSGKPATEFFGPRLFDFEFTDADRKPLARPSRVLLQAFHDLSGASAHEIAPGKSLLVVLRPSKFMSPMDYHLPPGGFHARVRYRGLTVDHARQLRKHWPDRPQSKAWLGAATSNEVSFAIAGDPAGRNPPPLLWGNVTDGLRAAVEFRRSAKEPADQTAPPGAFPLNSPVEDVIHLQNTTDKPLTLVSETWRQDDQVTVTDAAGEKKQLAGTWYSGLPIMVRWTLRPGDVAEIRGSGIGLVANDDAAKQLKHPIGKRLIATPGKYSLRYTIRLGGIRAEDGEGNLLYPAKDDWKGELVTAETPLVVGVPTEK